MPLTAAKRALPSLIALLVFAASGSGCGSSGVALDPVAQAAEVTSHVGGVHLALNIQLTVSGQPAPFTMSGSGFFNYRTHEGSLALDLSGLPSSAAGTELPGGTLHMEELLKSPDVYVTSPLLEGKLPGGAHWMKLDISRIGQAVGFNVQQLAGGQSNPAQFLEYLKASGGNVTALGRDAVRGVSTTRYRGTIDLGKVAGVLSSADRGQLHEALSKLSEQLGPGGLPVEVWVDDHRLVRRIVMVLALSAGGQSVQMRIATDLYGFGPTPAVTPPSESEVFDATQATLAGVPSGG
jgi:hypothetical protein